MKCRHIFYSLFIIFVLFLKEGEKEEERRKGRRRKRRRERRKGGRRNDGITRMS
jgi:hypothetical protein